MFTGLIDPYEDMLHLPDSSALRMLVIPHSMGGLMMTFEDVTSRLELESSYNTLIAVQKETLDNLGEAVAVFGSNGRLRLSNPSFGNLWGLHPEDLEGEPHVTTIVEKTKPFFTKEEWPARKEELVARGLDRTLHEGRLTRADGSLVDFTTVPLPDGGVLLTYSDVTDTVRVENALREKNAALEAAEQLKLDFLANVSYQLRTPSYQADAACLRKGRSGR
jgi:PAS domain S-box-containing protein